MAKAEALENDSQPVAREASDPHVSSGFNNLWVCYAVFEESFACPVKTNSYSAFKQSQNKFGLQFSIVIMWAWAQAGRRSINWPLVNKERKRNVECWFRADWFVQVTRIFTLKLRPYNFYWESFSVIFLQRPPGIPGMHPETAVGQCWLQLILTPSNFRNIIQNQYFYCDSVKTLINLRNTGVVKFRGLRHDSHLIN